MSNGARRVPAWLIHLHPTAATCSQLFECNLCSAWARKCVTHGKVVVHVQLSTGSYWCPGAVGGRQTSQCSRKAQKSMEGGRFLMQHQSRLPGTGNWQRLLQQTSCRQEIGDFPAAFLTVTLSPLPQLGSPRPNEAEVTVLFSYDSPTSLLVKPRHGGIALTLVCVRERERENAKRTMLKSASWAAESP